MKCPADEWGEGYKLIILYLLVLFVISDIFVKEPRRWPFVIEIFPDQESWLRIRKKHKKSDDKLKTGFWLIRTSQIWSNGRKMCQKGAKEDIIIDKEVLFVFWRMPNTSLKIFLRFSRLWEPITLLYRWSQTLEYGSCGFNLRVFRPPG